MKRVIPISLLGAMFAAASLAQPSNTWLEQWFKAKFGRYTAAEEARQRGQQIETAYREEARSQAAPAPSAYRTNEHLEQWYKAKFGRNSPMEEAYRRGEGKQ